MKLGEKRIKLQVSLTMIALVLFGSCANRYHPYVVVGHCRTRTFSVCIGKIETVLSYNVSIGQ